MTIKAERVIDVERLDHSLVDVYLSDQRLIDVLNHWVLRPHDRNEGLLYWARDKLQEIQPAHLTGVLWRGLRSSGQRVRTEAINYPIAFTTNPEIALAFGRRTVTTPAELVLDHSIVYTDELCYALALSRKLKTPVTQDEVLILPSVKEITITPRRPPLSVGAIW